MFNHRWNKNYSKKILQVCGYVALLGILFGIWGPLTNFIDFKFKEQTVFELHQILLDFNNSSLTKAEIVSMLKLQHILHDFNNSSLTKAEIVSMFESNLLPTWRIK